MNDQKLALIAHNVFVYGLCGFEPKLFLALDEPRVAKNPLEENSESLTC